MLPITAHVPLGRGSLAAVNMDKKLATKTQAMERER
jgi:hypothetical protein